MWLKLRYLSKTNARGVRVATARLVLKIALYYKQAANICRATTPLATCTNNEDGGTRVGDGEGQSNLED